VRFTKTRPLLAILLAADTLAAGAASGSAMSYLAADAASGSAMSHLCG